VMAKQCFFMGCREAARGKTSSLKIARPFLQAQITPVY